MARRRIPRIPRDIKLAYHPIHGARDKKTTKPTLTGYRIQINQLGQYAVYRNATGARIGCFDTKAAAQAFVDQQDQD